MIVTVMIMGMAGLGLTYLSVAYHRYDSGRRDRESELAFQAAASGLSTAVAEIRLSTDFGGDGVGFVDAIFNGGEASVTMDPPFDGPGEYHLRSVGRRGPHERGIEMVIGPYHGVQEALFADLGLSSGGSVVTDAYDSHLGTYASQAINVHPVTGKTIALEGGSVGSNGDLNVGNSDIHGDARPGVTGTLSIGSTGYVTGLTAPLDNDRVHPPISYAPEIPSAWSDLWISSATTVGAGTYRYPNAWIDQKLTITGDVTLYVDETVSILGQGQIEIAPGAKLRIVHGGLGSYGAKDPGRISGYPAEHVFHVAGGGFLNATGRPENLTVQSVGGDFYYGGTGQVKGHLDIPASRFIAVGGADFFGAVICKNAELEGTAFFHYDFGLERALEGRVRIKAMKEFHAWQEN